MSSGKNKNSRDEYGHCSICGYYTKFYYVELFNRESNEVKSCGWDAEFTENINVVNSMNCSHCYNKFRVRVAAGYLLSQLTNGKTKSIKKFLKGKINDFKILETAGTDGVFSSFGEHANIIKSEYFDDIPRGQYKAGIRSEDLQELTFENDTFDCVIALDVFEHIPDPKKAFSEVHRVLKKNGAGIITVPIDWRNPKTNTLAEMVNGEINFHTTPSYHSDPLRKTGALVFTEFGTNIKNNLLSEGYDANLYEFSDSKKRCHQYVIVIKK